MQLGWETQLWWKMFWGLILLYRTKWDRFLLNTSSALDLHLGKSEPWPQGVHKRIPYALFRENMYVFYTTEITSSLHVLVKSLRWGLVIECMFSLNPQFSIRKGPIYLFCQLWHKLVTWEGHLNWRILKIRLVHGHICGGFSWLLLEERGSSHSAWHHLPCR